MIEKSAMRILVLDDDPWMLKLLSHLLSKQGFTDVTTCESGSASLELLESLHGVLGLILCDLNMPEMDGVEFVRRLAERDYAGSLIFVSGEDERILKTAERLAHAHGISVLGSLHKPITPASLNTLLEKYLSSGRQEIVRRVRASYGADHLRDAIANGELVNYYQPKVSLTSGRVVGVESLVRWNHPLDGLVFPDQFIGLAEEHGLIDDLTRVVLTAALAQARIWRQAGLELIMSVNVSMDNLSTLGFADLVFRLTAAAGVLPVSVVLEVTESRLMKDLRGPLDVLARLLLKRFRLSIDDFGTGNSSLTQLLDIPFNELKVDHSFVHRAWADPTVLAIYEASLRLGKQIGIDTVAEGVEDRQDWDFVQRTGCDLGQGYFIARPMPAADLPGWIRDWELRAPDLLPPDR